MKKIFLLVFIIILQIYPITVKAVPTGWGEGWSDYSILSTASLISPAPQVLIDTKGHYHLFWLDKLDGNIQIKYMQTNNYGQTIQKPYFLTSDPDWIVKDYAAFLDEDNQIQLFYSTLYNGDFELRFSKVVPGEDNISYKILKAFYRPLQGLNGVKDSAGNFHLFWSNSDTGNHELYYSKLNPELDFIIDSKMLTISKGMTTSSKSAIDTKDQIHIVYNDNRLDTTWSLEYMVIDSKGNPLIYPHVISESMEYEDHVTPEIIVDNTDQIYLFWCLMNHGGFGSRNFDVYYTVINSDLQIKYEPIMLSEHSETAYAITYPPSTYVDDTNQIHAVWADSILEPINIIYKVIKEDQVIKPAEQLAVSLTGFVRPTIMIDKSGYRHLFFMEIIDRGLANISYMNTIDPAKITYWNWAGLDEDNLLFSLVYRLVRNLAFAAIGVLLNGVPIFVATIILLLLDKYKIKIALPLKALLLILIIFLIQLTPLAITVIGIRTIYKILAFLSAVGLFYLWIHLTRKRIKFIEVFAYLLGGVIFVYLYIFISLWPATAILLR